MNKKLKAGLDYLDGATSLGLGVACIVSYGNGSGAVMLILGIFWLISFVAWAAKKLTSRTLKRLMDKVKSYQDEGLPIVLDEGTAWSGTIRFTPLESYINPEGVTVITKARLEDVSIHMSAEDVDRFSQGSWER